MTRFAAAVAAAVIALLPLRATADPAPLRSPFADRVHALWKPGRAFGLLCPNPAPGPRDVAQVGQLRNFLDVVSQQSDGAVLGYPADCGLALLNGWAASGAMLGTVNRQGEYEREWTVGGLALAYLKLRDTGTLTRRPEERAAVEAWLAALARAIQPYYEGPEHERDQNNHAYWCGLSVAAAGIAANDRALYDWGIAKYRLGVGMIAPDGSLPLEMRRGARAAHDHLFAVMPLVLLAEMGEANGDDLYAFDGGALHRLAKLALHGAVDPAFFARVTGVPQDVAGHVRTDEIAWLEPYVARFGASPDATTTLRTARPIVYPRFGGALTQLYAPP